MKSPNILGIGLLAVTILFALAVKTPGLNNLSSETSQAYAVESGIERECLPSSSALFFGSQPIITTAA